MKSLRINCQDNQNLLKFKLQCLTALEQLILERFSEKFTMAKYFQIDLAIVNDEEIQKLNYKYRHKNTVTDVLSFAYEENLINFPISGEVKILGEIIINLDQVKRQAKKYKQSVEKEFYLLLIHGILHLLAYDHQKDEDAILMEDLEDQLLKMLFNL